ncbi:MAG: LamG-like jellyroll fold domain-containing protein, partial [Planctomycetota bacterium]|nr:LamG-like jellyroll fold domain-containing protein [Planctomycetota bacterium]
DDGTGQGGSGQDSKGQIAIVVIDSCLIAHEMMDEMKKLASVKTGIPTERILMSTTHTHSAPSVMGVLGTPPDEKYVKFLPAKVAEGVALAQKNLAPAKIGWAIGQLPELAQSRRWIARPDKMIVDPFGNKATRATMHPGYNNPNFEESSGPMDPSVSVLSVRSPDGKPIALLAAYSIHYVGSPALSADYFGVFANKIAKMVGAGDSSRPFVGILANGTSGDAYINNYSGKPHKHNRFTVAEAVAKVAFDKYQSMEMHDWVPLVMAEEVLELSVRKPKLDWARPIMKKIGDRPPKTSVEVYAREQIYLSKMPPTRKMRLQALRVGELGIAAIPAEVFAITGLKIRRRSSLQPTFTISMANGSAGYLPPPEQMAMGGYTTYLARSSCLETAAEPKVAAAMLRLLDKVAGDARVAPAKRTASAYETAVAKSKPLAFLPLDEMNGPGALNVLDGKTLGKYETQIAYFMPGPRPPKFPGMSDDNRAAHFVGQRLLINPREIGGDSVAEQYAGKYSVEFWFYNAMPCDARDTTGYLFSLGPLDDPNQTGEHLAIGGKNNAAGKLLFHGGKQTDGSVLIGKTAIAMRDWTHVALVRDGSKVAVYLNGSPTPELAGSLDSELSTDVLKKSTICLGGRSDGFCNFEGKIALAAFYDRPLADIVEHYKAATS